MVISNDKYGTQDRFLNSVMESIRKEIENEALGLKIKVQTHIESELNSMVNKIISRTMLNVAKQINYESYGDKIVITLTDKRE